MAQLVSLLLIALGSLGLWWLFGQRRPLPDPGAITGPSLP
jgi:phosphatidylglycerol:prolipoprotein diacylglycerol transferase